MLKGHVFKKQVFGNQIFALFMDTFLNKKCGVLGNYKNKMQVTYSGSTLTIDSGAVCIRGRFLEEDTSTDIEAGTDTAYCKLVVEIDLDKENTDETLAQAIYKIVKSESGYPVLTQTDIISNNSGIYQFELAQFRTSSSGISDFVDKRTYLDFDSIYQQIEDEIHNIEDGSIYVLKTDLLDSVYPIGSIYLSINNINPSILFGGTWVAWGTGRVPVGVDINDTAFNTVEKTGGEKTHKLTIDEMPSHKHGSSASGRSNIGTLAYESGLSTTVHSNVAGWTDNEGGGQPHNNLQPYITCYMWKRTN